jgi:hypothetical protein
MRLLVAECCLQQFSGPGVLPALLVDLNKRASRSLLLPGAAAGQRPLSARCKLVMGRLRALVQQDPVAVTCAASFNPDPHIMGCFGQQQSNIGQKSPCCQSLLCLSSRNNQRDSGTCTGTRLTTHTLYAGAAAVEGAWQ